MTASNELEDREIRHNLLKDVLNKTSAVDGSAQDNFVRAWYSRMQRADRLSDRFKLWYYVSLTLTSLAAASVPVLISAAGSSDVQTAILMRGLAAWLGVFVAVTTSVLGVVQVGSRWRVYRIYGQQLEDAGWDYLANSDKSAYDHFVKVVNTAHRTYDSEYLSQVAALQDGQSALKR
jgi:hypothetical protein